MHLGLDDWPTTARALIEVDAAMRASGHTVDRYGLCLSRSMGVLEGERAVAAKETGPRLAPGDWDAIAETVPIQPHLGDFMIGTPAGLQNTRRALAVGATTIGNLGQYFAFETPGGADDVALTDTTVRALATLSGLREAGALVHSYLDDGPAMQFSHYGAYVGWAALELYVVEELLGARLAHCYGGVGPRPKHRAVVGFALARPPGRGPDGAVGFRDTR